MMPSASNLIVGGSVDNSAPDVVAQSSQTCLSVLCCIVRSTGGCFILYEPWPKLLIRDLLPLYHLDCVCYCLHCSLHSYRNYYCYY